MYYLNVVMDVIQYKAESRLRDFNNYFQLSEEEKQAVYKLALLLNPKIFIEAGIFIVDPSWVPQGKINDFLKITDEKIGVHVNEEIIIVGRSIKVLHIMVCKNEWLNRYYNVPMAEITNFYRNRNRRILEIRQSEPILRTEEQMIRTIPYTNNPIIINQVAPRFMPSPKLGPSSVTMACPYCKNYIYTITNSEFNFVSCCLCCLLGFIFYACFQLCQGKSILCENVEHTCPACGAFIGKYESC